MSRTKKAVLIMGVLILVITVLRESGIVDINLYQTKSQEDYTSSITRRNTPDHYPFEGFTINLNDNIDSGIKKALEKIKGSPDKNGLTFNITSFEEEITGPLYLPLYKTPRASYECEFEAKGQHNSREFNLSGKVSGDVKFQILFICSGNKARGLIYQAIAKHITKTFENELKR
ncbi:MAG: hypothetical protein ACYS9T_04700 [Planctomycetota bacterium]|jgi:hypothetical protein